MLLPDSAPTTSVGGESDSPSIVRSNNTEDEKTDSVVEIVPEANSTAPHDSVLKSTGRRGEFTIERAPEPRPSSSESWKLDDSKKAQKPSVFWQALFTALLQIWSEKESRLQLLAALLKFFQFFFEVSVALWTGSQALMAHSCHQLFDCASLACRLSTQHLSKRAPTLRYSYGYNRFEVLVDFSSAVFHVFVSVLICLECFHRLLQPEQLSSAPFCVLLSIVVNGIALIVFRKQLDANEDRLSQLRQRHTSTGRSGAGAVVVGAGYRKATAPESASVFVGTHGSTFTALPVLLSALLISWQDWWTSDSLAASVVCVGLIQTAWPVLQATAYILLQTTPPGIRGHLDKCLREVATLDDVLECRSEHFWTQAPGVYVGSFCVRVRGDADEQAVLSHIAQRFEQLLTHLTVQVEKDDFQLFNHDISRSPAHC